MAVYHTLEQGQASLHGTHRLGEEVIKYTVCDLLWAICVDINILGAMKPTNLVAKSPLPSNGICHLVQ